MNIIKGFKHEILNLLPCFFLLALNVVFANNCENEVRHILTFLGLPENLVSKNDLKHSFVASYDNNGRLVKIKYAEDDKTIPIQTKPNFFITRTVTPYQVERKLEIEYKDDLVTFKMVPYPHHKTLTSTYSLPNGDTYEWKGQFSITFYKKGDQCIMRDFTDAQITRSGIFGLSKDVRFAKVLRSIKNLYLFQKRDLFRVETWMTPEEKMK